MVLNDSDAVEAADLQRRRVLAAFSTGTASDPGQLARRPNRALSAGVAVTVLACLGTGMATLVKDKVPKDWAQEGNVVVRSATGARYLAAGGQLRPVRNDTSLALAGLPSPRVVRVDEVRFGTRPVGSPFGIEGAPARRPQVPDDNVRWWACQQPGSPLALLTGGGPTSGGRALLASVGDPAQLELVADGLAHPLSADVATALGYDARTARPLPTAFAALLPAGPPLVRLPRAAPPPALPTTPRPAPAAAPAPSPAPGAATPAPSPAPPPPAFLAAGTLVQDTGSNALYVADGGQLRPVEGATALRLLYGGPPPSPTRVAASERSAVPEGPPLRVAGFPATPPPATGPRTYVCVTSAGGVVAEEPELPVLGLSAGAAAARPDRVTVWQPAGTGALVRPDRSQRAAVTAADPLLLVTEGRAFPVPDEGALPRLGMKDEQVRSRPSAWLALLGRGPALRPLRLDDPRG